MKTLFVLFLGIFLISSCKRTNCNAVRYDTYFLTQFTNDTDTFTYVAVEMPSNPRAPTPTSTNDTINKLKQMGYRIINQTASLYKFIDCEDCQKILQYHPNNLCIENK